MGKGVDFAGKGDMDAMISKDSTSAPSTGGSLNTIDFAGNGGMDATSGPSDTMQHQPNKEAVPNSSGTVDFEGLGGKDLK